MSNSQLEPDFIDIEEYVKADKEIPRKRRYRIKVDRDFLLIDKEGISGAEILTKAGKNPKNYQLIQVFRFNRREIVENEEIVDVAACGVERFVTLPLDQTEGKTNRQDFVLPESDLFFLKNFPNIYDTIQENNFRWLIIRDYPIPNGYNVEKADVALCVDGAYPISQIDMVYFYPALSLINCKSIGALANQPIEGKIYQRWSRHRTPSNPWRAGIDDISTHLLLVNHWLKKELLK